LTAVKDLDATRRAGKLAAAIMRERHAGVERAVEQGLAPAQRHGEVVHGGWTRKPAQRSGRR
jgi:hypothetical protein